MKRALCALISLVMLASSVCGCSGAPVDTASSDKNTEITETTETEDNGTKIMENENYYVISSDEYVNKTTAGFLSQMIGFLSDYKYVWNSDGTPKIAMPDTWYMGICRGNDAPDNPYHSKVVKLFYNEDTKLWETWIADAFSIDILDQYIIRDMYKEYGTVTTKVITDGWVEYKPWDMGGGSRTAGAYNLASKKKYISPYLGSAEYGNRYSWCQEPWIGNDSLGMVAAGMPNTAVDLTKIFGRVTGDSDNVLWLDFVAAMSAMAYFEDDIPTLIKTAAKLFPEDSWEKQVVEMSFGLFEKYPESWRRAVIFAERECARRFYYLHTGRSTNEQGRVEVNMAFMILGLLYGNGDYYETSKILSLCGYDTRGTIMLPILGIIGGMDVIPKEALDVTWQEGKGEIVNKPIDGTVSGLWMYADDLPERYKIADIIQMYRKNFESVLLEKGGKIEEGYYYIPKTEFMVYDSVKVDNHDFEDPTLGNAVVYGDKVKLTSFAYWGEQAVEIGFGSGIYTVLNGLKKGETYKATAYVIADNKATVSMYARNTDGNGMCFATVTAQSEYVKRELVFTATSDSMQLGFEVTGAANASGKVDEITVIRITESEVEGIGDVTVESTPSASGSYTGNIVMKVSGRSDRQVYLKVVFANTRQQIVDGHIYVNGRDFNVVPFYKTSSALKEGAADCVYIPVVLKRDNNSINIDVGSASLYITSAEIVDVSDRLMPLADTISPKQ